MQAVVAPRSHYFSLLRDFGFRSRPFRRILLKKRGLKKVPLHAFPPPFIKKNLVIAKKKF